jgi:hypothetical protein
VRRALVVPCLLLVAACRAHRGADASPVELTGLYTPGFETSRFVPCDARAGDAPWWVILSADALRQRDSLRALLPDDAGGTVFVRWRAVVGPDAPTGHLGAYARWVHVAEVVALDAPDAPAAAACDAVRATWSDWRVRAPRAQPPRSSSPAATSPAGAPSSAAANQ